MEPQQCPEMEPFIKEDPLIAPRIGKKKKKTIKEPKKTKTTTQRAQKLIQKQLVLLLHSHVCLRKNFNLLLPNHPVCQVPNCPMMQGVWLHIKTCKIGPECPHQHCLSSLKILAHWKHCKDDQCPVCQLVRIKGAQQLELRARQEQSHPQINMMGGALDPTDIFLNQLASSSSSSSNSSCNMMVGGQSTSQPYQGRIIMSPQCQGQSQPGNENLLLDSSCLNYNSATTAADSHAIHDVCDPINYHHPNFYDDPQPHNYSMEAWRAINVLNGNQSPVSPVVEGQGLFYPQPSPPYDQQSSSTSSASHSQYDPLTLVAGPVVESLMDNSSQNLENDFNYSGQIGDCYDDDDPQTETKSLSSTLPTANDVKIAYEELGIPCPADALRRLMATLPGGCPEDEAVDNVLDVSRRHSSDTDDGIHDTMSFDLF